MHSGKPVKSLLGECQPGVCSAWASALQGHGCPAALWPVPGHQTRGRKQHTGASGCGQQRDGLAEPLGAYPLTQGPQHPPASADEDPTCTTRGGGAPRPREPLRTGHHSATSLGPLLRAPCQCRARGCTEHGPCPQGTARLQGCRQWGEHCPQQPAVVGVGDSQPPKHRGPARHRLCSERALSLGLSGGHQAVDRVGGAHWARGGGGGAAADRGLKSSSCLGSQAPVPSVAWHTAHTSMGKTGHSWMAGAGLTSAALGGSHGRRASAESSLTTRPES